MHPMLPAVGLLALITTAAEAWHVFGLHQDAARQRAANASTLRLAKSAEAEVRTLEEGKAAVAVVHARLVDSTVPPEMAAPGRPTVPGAPRPDTAASFKLPAPFEVLQREGARWRFSPREVPAGDRSRAVRGEANAEFHRLLPLLAAMENLFPLVSTDEITLSLPAGAAAFATQATPLQVEASFRVPLRSGAGLPEKR